MCGYSIIKKDKYNEKINSLLSHRGVSSAHLETNSWSIDFHSLPLSSFNSNKIQPLKTAKGNYLLLNGEIFNHKELDNTTKNDLEYLLKLCDKKGDDITKIEEESVKWDGFWAITLIKLDKLFFFTDPLGKKQLYHSALGICSEIKPINDNSLLCKYNKESFGTSQTPFFDITRALPGVIYCYEYRYQYAYKLSYKDYFKRVIIGKESLYELLDLAVLNRTINRIDGVSLLLSSGIDSNIILHHLQKNNIKFEAVTMDNGELQYTKLIYPEVKQIDETFTDSDLDNFVMSYEHPIDYGSMIPNYLLFKSCSNSVVITGDGSDELFGGYKRALENDTQKFDLFMEIPFYHNIRIDRASMHFTKEARSPFLSHSVVKYALSLKREQRTSKKILFDVYKGLIPDICFENKKQPLRYKNNKEKNIELINNKFYKLNK